MTEKEMGDELGDTETDYEEGEGYGDPFFGEESGLYGSARGLTSFQ
jgi:hypothetical protein